MTTQPITKIIKIVDVAETQRYIDREMKRLIDNGHTSLLNCNHIHHSYRGVIIMKNV